MNPMKTKTIVVAVLAVALLAGMAGRGNVPRAAAEGVAQQTVSFAVDPIRALTVSGDPDTLIVTTVDATGQIEAVVDSSTTYAIATNVPTPQKVTARLNENMPLGLTLHVYLEPPAGALSEQWVALSTIDEVVVSQIQPIIESNLFIHYRLEATVSAVPSSYDVRTVTLTLTDD